jgi:hypothetical protein
MEREKRKNCSDASITLLVEKKVTTLKSGRASQSSIIIVDITHTTTTTQHFLENTGKKHRPINGYIYTKLNNPSLHVRERIGHKHFIILLFLSYFYRSSSIRRKKKTEQPMDIILTIATGTFVAAKGTPTTCFLFSLSLSLSRSEH